MQERSSQEWDGRFFVFNMFDPHPCPSTLSGTRPSKGEGNEGEKMNTQTESQALEATAKTENPMQERHCEQVAESVEITAEAVFTARRLEAREEAGPVFVP